MHQYVIANLDIDKRDVGRVGHAFSILDVGLVALDLDYLTGYRQTDVKRLQLADRSSRPRHRWARGRE